MVNTYNIHKHLSELLRIMSYAFCILFQMAPSRFIPSLVHVSESWVILQYLGHYQVIKLFFLFFFESSIIILVDFCHLCCLLLTTEILLRASWLHSSLATRSDDVGECKKSQMKGIISLPWFSYILCSL